MPMRGALGASVPRSPFDNRWYAHIDGKTYGPYSGHEVQRLIGQRKILDTDFLCPAGGEEWIQAGRLEIDTYRTAC